MSDAHDVRDLESGNRDIALLRRLFDLTLDKRGEGGELERVDSQVYARLMEAYEPEPAAPERAAA